MHIITEISLLYCHMLKPANDRTSINTYLINVETIKIYKGQNKLFS